MSYVRWYLVNYSMWFNTRSTLFIGCTYISWCAHFHPVIWDIQSRVSLYRSLAIETSLLITEIKKITNSNFIFYYFFLAKFTNLANQQPLKRCFGCSIILCVFAHTGFQVHRAYPRSTSFTKPERSLIQTLIRSLKMP